MRRDFGPSVLLPKVAHEMLIETLNRHGNHVSPQHALSLEQLLDGFTKQGLGISPGRRAYGLPCGSGKTLSVVAWTAAQYHLGLSLSVAISAQQIDSLCNIKSSLIEAGVPEPQIGIRHTAGSAALWRDTGDEDRLIMLGSHVRIQGKAEMPAFCRHKGQPRDLLIWDESLISSDSTTLNVQDAKTSLGHFCADGSRPLLSSILQRLRDKVEGERLTQRSGGEASIFALLSDEESDAALEELGQPYCVGFAWEALRKARETLRQLRHPMSVLDVGDGNAGLVLMRCRIALDPALENIAVLDASYVVSELCKADPTIRDATTTAMLEYKDYSDVLVEQTTAASGRWKFSRKAERVLALTAAVNSIKSIPEDETILVVTYMARDGLDLVRDLKRELLVEGIAHDALTHSGKSRISFTTWGKHTTDNSFSGSRHVVALGVVRQSSATVAASMAGQRDDASYRMTPERLAEVELSLLASSIMQAMSRGSCRRVNVEGKALPMTLHLITKELGLEALMKKAMRGLQWQTTSAAPPTRKEDAARRIAAYMLNVPEAEGKVSKRSIFASLNIGLASAAKAEAMAQAMAILAIEGLRSPRHRWKVAGQSLVRKHVE